MRADAARRADACTASTSRASIASSSVTIAAERARGRRAAGTACCAPSRCASSRSVNSRLRIDRGQLPLEHARPSDVDHHVEQERRIGRRVLAGRRYGCDRRTPRPVLALADGCDITPVDERLEPCGEQLERLADPGRLVMSAIDVAPRRVEATAARPTAPAPSARVRSRWISGHAGTERVVRTGQRRAGPSRRSCTAGRRGAGPTRPARRARRSSRAAAASPPSSSRLTRCCVASHTGVRRRSRGSQSSGSSSRPSSRTLPPPERGSRPRPCPSTDDVHRHGQLLGHAVRTLVEPRTARTSDRPPGLRVELALLLVEHLVEHLVDQPERRAHPHRRPVRLDHLGVPREHRHPRPDRRLRAGPPARCAPSAARAARRAARPCSAPRKPLPVGDAGASRARAAGEHDRRRRGRWCRSPIMRCQLGAHRPGRSDHPARSRQALEHRLPAGRRDARRSPCPPTA